MKRNDLFKKVANILILIATLLILVYLIVFVYMKGYSFNKFLPIYVVWLIALLLKVRMDQKDRLARRKQFLKEQK